MWSPTHIQVTVQRAKGLLSKGKNGTNNCFVTIALGKEKYQTSVKEKATENVDWHEECELTIPDRGNRAELVLTCLHRNNLGIDEFLGQAILPLNEMDVYDRPRSKWHKLESKPGKEKKKERGELEVRISFIVKSGSLTDLSKKEKHKSSIGQLATSVGGSLLSLGTIEKRKGIKKFAKSLGSKMHITSKSKKVKGSDSDSFTGSFASIGTPNSAGARRFGQSIGDADPGVISEDEDEFVFDNLSHKSSGSSLNIRGIQNPRIPSPTFSSKEESLSNSPNSKLSPPSKPPRISSDQKQDEWEAKLFGKHLDIGSTDSLKRRSWEASRVPLPKKEEKENIPEIVKTMEESAPKQPIEIIQSSTAPSSPVLETKKEESSKIKETYNELTIRPQPLPRSNTFACLIDKNKDSDKQEKGEKKRFGKLKYFRRDKAEALDDGIIQKQFGERIIIGHENAFLKSGVRNPEISQELLKKYEGKSREEVMLIANNMEHEATIQRQRVKELEDYLDDLLLRVMETHPKILQNPYTRTTSTKSG